MERHNIKSSIDGQGVWWHPGDKGPLDKLPYILQFGSMKFSKVRMDYTMYPHTHPGIGIRFIHSGKFRWMVESNEIDLYPDNISIINPWQMYGSPYGKTDIGEYSWMVIKPLSYNLNTPLRLGPWSQISPELQENIGRQLTKEKTIVLRNAKKLKKYFVELKQELQKQETGYEIVAKNLINNLFINLYRELTHRQLQNEKDDHFINDLTNLISSDLTKKWIIEDLALRFGMGKTKFTDEVRKLTGYPPASFILNLKINKSMEMLQEASSSLSEIAYVCGFSSLQHYTSSFSNRIGVGPGKYRKSEI